MENLAELAAFLVLIKNFDGMKRIDHTKQDAGHIFDPL
jgi:hypothetical protein